VDPGLEAAFRYVERLLFGDVDRPGLTLYDVERLVGYPAKGEGPLTYAFPRTKALSGVQAVRLYYYPKDPHLQLILEIEDLEGRKHLRHFRWDGFTWEVPEGKRGDLRSTQESLDPFRVGEDYFLGFPREEAKELEEAVRKGEALGAKYLLCPRCGTRTFYAPSVRPAEVVCPRCGNATLLFKTFSGVEPAKDPLEALAEEQRALRRTLEELMAYLKRKLGP
jgi:ribosomal protein S27AE